MKQLSLEETRRLQWSVEQTLKSSKHLTRNKPQLLIEYKGDKK